MIMRQYYPKNKLTKTLAYSALNSNVGGYERLSEKMECRERAAEVQVYMTSDEGTRSTVEAPLDVLYLSNAFDTKLVCTITIFTTPCMVAISWLALQWSLGVFDPSRTRRCYCEGPLHYIMKVIFKVLNMNRWTSKDCEDGDWVEIVERDRNVRPVGESFVERQQQLIGLLHDNIKRLRKIIEQRDDQIGQLKKETHMLRSRIANQDSSISMNQDDLTRASNE
ncbi:hypothetical protein EV361DRAFT_874356 [Lentinula raphanica]|nr:hypothetical protein EV361DRAFT_874356 [Lentinula raphanica]